MSTGTSGAPVAGEDTDDDDDSLEFDSNREPATVARSPNGQLRGVAVYLSAEDLRNLGITQDAEAVVPSVYKGTLVLRQVQPE